MSKWDLDIIREKYKQKVKDKTANWPEEVLRDKLIELLTAIHPLTCTLEGLIDNPDVKYGGMTVTSGLFLDHTLLDVAADFPEPYGVKYNSKLNPPWEPISFKWNEKQPEDLQKVEAEFPKGITLHDDTDILSIWQFATAASIFIGSFDVSDVRNLLESIRI